MYAIVNDEENLEVHTDENDISFARTFINALLSKPSVRNM